MGPEHTTKKPSSKVIPEVYSFFSSVNLNASTGLMQEKLSIKKQYFVMNTLAIG